MDVRGNSRAEDDGVGLCPGRALVRLKVATPLRKFFSSRIVWFRLAAFASVLSLSANAVAARGYNHGQPQHSQPAHGAPSPHSAPAPRGPSGNSNRNTTNEDHLKEWLQKNKGLSTDEQVKKLQQEQGFNRLTPQQQQSVTNHLRELNQMQPARQQRTLDRMENLERLPPQQQEQVRASARSLGQMPPARQQAVKDAIRQLRNVPPGLRQSELNSKYGSQLSPDERGVVSNLLSIESYHPPPPPPRGSLRIGSGSWLIP
jgi:hypothetical protein